jgi:hypothetical protein
MTPCPLAALEQFVTGIEDALRRARALTQEDFTTGGPADEEGTQ